MALRNGKLAQSPGPGKIKRTKEGYYIPSFTISDLVTDSRLSTSSGTTGTTFDHPSPITNRSVDAYAPTQLYVGDSVPVTSRGKMLSGYFGNGKIVTKSMGYFITTNYIGTIYKTDAVGNIVTFSTYNGSTSTSLSYMQGKQVSTQNGLFIPTVIAGGHFPGNSLPMTYKGISYSVGIEIEPPFQPRLYPKPWHPAVYNGQKKNSQPLDKRVKK